MRRVPRDSRPGILFERLINTLQRHCEDHFQANKRFIEQWNMYIEMGTSKFSNIAQKRAAAIVGTAAVHLVTNRMVGEDCTELF